MKNKQYLYIRNLKKTEMKNAALTAQQLEMVKILIRLGDSEDLAIKTVLSTTKSQNEIDEACKFYRNAYTN